MKNFTKLLLLVLAVFLCAPNLSAGHRKKGERISREQLAEKQAKLIAEKLSLSKETSDKFIATFMQNQKEVWALDTPKARTTKTNVAKNRARKVKQKAQVLTEAQTDSMLRARLSHSQKILNIRKKYYEEYRKFLTAKQVEKVYKLESQMLKRLKSHKNYRKR